MELLKAATRPLVIIGAGANRRRVRKQLEGFVNKYGIFAVATQMGKGVLSERHPKCVTAAVLGCSPLGLRCTRAGGRCERSQHLAMLPHLAAPSRVAATSGAPRSPTTTLCTRRARTRTLYSSSAFCRPPAADRLLPTACCRSPAADRLRPTACCQAACAPHSTWPYLPLPPSHKASASQHATPPVLQATTWWRSRRSSRNRTSRLWWYT